MHKVTIYTETTLKGPCIKDGQYAAVIEFEKQNGQTVTRNIFGAEKETTYHRSTLLACLKALELLNVPCQVHVFTSDQLIVSATERSDLEKWSRNEWKNSKNEDLKNKDLWQLFKEQLEKHEVTIERVTSNGYSKWMFDQMRSAQ